MFPILRFAVVTYRNLSIFCLIFHLHHATRHFCEVTALTRAFYDLVSKKQTYP